MKSGIDDKYYYPDLVLTKGEEHYLEDAPDTLLNPFLLIEVLSNSTEARDRGPKFEAYRSIDSLREYVLVAQDKYQIKGFYKNDEGEWIIREPVAGLDSAFSFTLLDLVLKGNGHRPSILFLIRSALRIFVSNWELLGMPGSLSRPPLTVTDTGNTSMARRRRNPPGPWDITSTESPTRKCPWPTSAGVEAVAPPTEGERLPTCAIPKQLGLNMMGRNIMLGLRLPFGFRTNWPALVFLQ